LSADFSISACQLFSFCPGNFSMSAFALLVSAFARLSFSFSVFQLFSFCLGNFSFSAFARLSFSFCLSDFCFECRFQHFSMSAFQLLPGQFQLLPV